MLSWLLRLSDLRYDKIFSYVLQEIPKGSIYNYILSTETCLGPLTYLRIWHDNNGKGKQRSWFLDQVQLTDLQTGEKYVDAHSAWPVWPPLVRFLYQYLKF